MKPDATLKPDLTLEHALAAADGSESLRHAEQQVRALPDDLA
jgi:hypothetical protein